MKTFLPLNRDSDLKAVRLPLLPPCPSWRVEKTPDVTSGLFGAYEQTLAAVKMRLR